MKRLLSEKAEETIYWKLCNLANYIVISTSDVHPEDVLLLKKIEEKRTKEGVKEKWCLIDLYGSNSISESTMTYDSAFDAIEDYLKSEYFIREFDTISEIVGFHKDTETGVYLN